MPTEKIDKYLEIDVTMGDDGLKILLLHRHPEYLKATCLLINDEWPRSETARMMTLQASCDELPTSIILINAKKQVLGHCKLTAIPRLPQSVFLETVVISKSMRGKKLGTFLMKEVEEYCRTTLKLMMVHLSTKGQEKFYEKLGYILCKPVSIYGTRLPSLAVSDPPKNEIKVPDEPKNIIPGGPNPPPPPPPPPPPMPTNNSISTKCSIQSKTTFMFKFL